MQSMKFSWMSATKVPTCAMVSGVLRSSVLINRFSASVSSPLFRGNNLCPPTAHRTYHTMSSACVISTPTGVVDFCERIKESGPVDFFFHDDRFISFCVTFPSISFLHPFHHIKPQHHCRHPKSHGHSEIAIRPCHRNPRDHRARLSPSEQKHNLLRHSSLQILAPRLSPDPVAQH